MSLYDLPNEILSLLPLHINNIETFTNAASSCRHLRHNFAQTRPETVLRLAASSAPTFFSPHPHFLVAATARQVSDWALGNEHRTSLLQKAFQGGIDGLYEFCLEHAGLTLDDIRRLHRARFNIINPLSDMVDKMAGHQWYQTENFWNGGVSEAETLYTQPDRAVFQIIIYGELFGRGMEALLDPGKGLPFFDPWVRLEYLKYCVPDWRCKLGYSELGVLQVGPYVADVQEVASDQGTLKHVLRCRRWRRMWARAVKAGTSQDGEEDDIPEVEDDVDDEHWKTKMYRDALQTQGLEGMQLVTLPKDQIPEQYLDNSRRFQRQISMLEKAPDSVVVGPRQWLKVSNAPDPAQDVLDCVARSEMGIRARAR